MRDAVLEIRERGEEHDRGRRECVEHDAGEQQMRRATRARATPATAWSSEGRRDRAGEGGGRAPRRSPSRARRRARAPRSRRPRRRPRHRARRDRRADCAAAPGRARRPSRARRRPVRRARRAAGAPAARCRGAPRRSRPRAARRAPRPGAIAVEPDIRPRPSARPSASVKTAIQPTRRAGAARSVQRLGGRRRRRRRLPPRAARISTRGRDAGRAS